MRSTMTLFLGLSIALGASQGKTLPPKYTPPEISIVSGTYGGNCHVPTGNVTASLAAACNGKTSCDYVVDYHVIGDPAYGCAKDYVATWRCGPNGAIETDKAAPEAGYGSHLQLSCTAGISSGASLPTPPPAPATTRFVPCHGNAASFLELAKPTCSGPQGTMLTLYVSRAGMPSKPIQAYFAAGPIGALHPELGRQPYGPAKIFAPLIPAAGNGLTPNSTYTLEIPNLCVTGPRTDFAFDLFVPTGGSNQDIDAVEVIC